MRIHSHQQMTELFLTSHLLLLINLITFANIPLPYPFMSLLISTVLFIATPSAVHHRHTASEDAVSYTAIGPAI
jgi:hypothetical protein